MSVTDNVAIIRERMATAAKRVGRDPQSITLMAVTKTVDPERISEAFYAGLRVFGENRVQEFENKRPKLGEFTDGRWHLIGHLQSNKSARAVELFDAVDSVDSLRLAERLDRAASALNRVLSVLIEINVGDEQSKSGLPLDSPDLDSLLLGLAGLEHIEVHGLMAVQPFVADANASRPYFRVLRDLRDTIAARKLPRVGMDTLSMGMSHDFEVAIEEGSTCVRVGTAIFGERPKP